jgi:bifunctional non-homologous end joining protein LigD
MRLMTKLEEYRRKRHFDKTPEPAGEDSGLAMEHVFVVQKHRARRLHYDFRLAIGGTLVSWAVPKGPSQNSADKRLAVQTEDHPLEYGGFEGKIPEGSYGAGTVMLWDRGTFALEGDASADKQMARGEIKFTLNGEKLRGSFALVKLKNSAKGNEWLMIKHKDAAEDPNWDIEAHDGSVLTGLTLDEIAAEAQPRRGPIPLNVSDIEEARKAPMPQKLSPMLATLTDDAFSDPNWLFEIKWDGVRALAWIADGKYKLRARSGNDIAAQYPELAPLAKGVIGREAILDGEIVALDEHGYSSFERLQDRMHVRNPSPNLVAKSPVVYQVFDLLYCDGYDLRGAPLLQRKQLLQRFLRTSPALRYCDHVAGQGQELFELAKQKGLEGIVAKHSDSRYVGERSTNWLKVKATQTLDAVVGGWTAPRGSTAFGALLLGLYEGKKLHFVGHVGTGWDAAMQKEILGQLQEHKIASSPFDKLPETNEKPSWASPYVVARVRYGGWTDERRLRHPVFMGLCEDVKAEDCRLDATMPMAKSAAVVRAPAVVGKILSSKAEIESALFKKNLDNATLQIDGKTFRLSNLNKVYFPETGYSKRDLLAYYYQMADCVLPYLKDRPLVLRRYPDGIAGQSFFQKDLREGMPDWLKTVTIESETKAQGIHYAIANDLASLLFLTGLGCIDHNPWSSRYQDAAHPDYFFFDLDPSDGTDFSVVVKIARALYDRLRELQLDVFIKTSGATGIHMYLPVEPVYNYEQLRTFAEIVARIVATENPNLVTNERSVAKRPAGRVLIDVHQNAEGRPLAAPYVVRAFPKAPVSTPILPNELRVSLQPEKLNMKTVFTRLKEKGELWSDFWKKRQRLEGAIELLSRHIEPANNSRPTGKHKTG